MPGQRSVDVHDMAERLTAGGIDAGLPDICVRPDLSTPAPIPWERGVAQCHVAGPELEYFLCEPAPGSPNGWRHYGEGPGNVYTVGRRPRRAPAAHPAAPARLRTRRDDEVARFQRHVTD